MDEGGTRRGRFGIKRTKEKLEDFFLYILVSKMRSTIGFILGNPYHYIYGNTCQHMK
jgi:hypothetical protein